MTIIKLIQNRSSFKPFAAASLLMLSACAQPGQNRYGYQDVGNSSVLEFGIIVSERQVDITGQNTGAGAAIGVGGGAIAGSAIGRGNGSLAGLLAGAVIGGIAGAVAEQAMADRKGIEYIVTERDGKTISIVQNIAGDDSPLRIGQRVVVQTGGTYKRVLPAENLPEEVQRPVGIRATD